MIYVKMAESIPLDMDYRGIAITGTLTIPDTTDGNAFWVRNRWYFSWGRRGVL